MSLSSIISMDSADGISDNVGLVILPLGRDRSCSSIAGGPACDLLFVPHSLTIFRRRSFLRFRWFFQRQEEVLILKSMIKLSLNFSHPMQGS